MRIAPPGGRALTYKVTVLTVDAGRELRWVDRFVRRGVFDGEHSFRIEPLGEGRCRFVQSERFSGVLAGILNSARKRTALGFEQMNDALKERAEQVPRGARATRSQPSKSRDGGRMRRRIRP